jgi:uncharacterized membrane protein YfcA
MPLHIHLALIGAVGGLIFATVDNRNARGAAACWASIRGAGWYATGATTAALLVAIAVGRHPNVVSRQSLAALQLLPAACLLVPRDRYALLRASHCRLKDTTIGALVGGASTFIGVGGGTYTMFYFLVQGRSIKDCALTSSVVGIFIGLMGVVGYGGSHATRSVPMSSHVLDTVSQLLLIGCGALASPLGLRLQSHVPPAAVRTLMFLILALSSACTLVRA